MEITENKVTSREVKATETVDGYGNINADMSITIGTNVTNKTNINLGKVLEK